jgi:hypothetical protein
MKDPLEITLKEAIEKMRDAGNMPIGIVSYDMGKDELKFSLLHGVDPEEANALLERLGIKVTFT